MVFRHENGDTLEVFLRWTGSSRWSVATARQFLSQFVQTDDAVVQIRRGLGLRLGDLPASREEVCYRVALMIASGALMPVQPGFEQREPGTGFVVRSGVHSVLFLRRPEVNRGTDLAAGRQWIENLLISGLPPDVDRLFSSAVCGQMPGESGKGGLYGWLESFLLAGEFLFRCHLAEAITDAIDGEVSFQAPSRSPAPAERSEAPESATFPSNIDAARIAALKREAARLGIPFCEECLKRALAASG